VGQNALPERLCFDDGRDSVLYCGGGDEEEGWLL